MLGNLTLNPEMVEKLRKVIRACNDAAGFDTAEPLLAEDVQAAIEAVEDEIVLWEMNNDQAKI